MTRAVGPAAADELQGVGAAVSTRPRSSNRGTAHGTAARRTACGGMGTAGARARQGHRGRAHQAVVAAVHPRQGGAHTARHR